MDECDIISQYVAIKITNQIVKKIFQLDIQNFFRTLPYIVGESSVSSVRLNLYVKIPNMEQKTSVQTGFLLTIKWKPFSVWLEEIFYLIHNINWISERLIIGAQSWSISEK